MNNYLRKFAGAVTVGLLALSMQAVMAAPQFREDTVLVRKSGGLFAAEIETQIYLPAVEGHFPIVVINHGHAEGKSALDMRESLRGQALEFVKRGYVVVVPFRTGYSHSSGNSNIKASCFTASLGRQWAEDVIAAINYAKQLPDADPTRIVVIGQSQGGFTTAALGSLSVSGVIGLVNFVGAAREPHCKEGYGPATDAYGAFGSASHVPALFMYGDNDMYGSAAASDSVPRGYLNAYNDAGGQATLYDYGVYGNDSHVMFHHKDALSIWEPPVGKFFQSIGLSWDVVYPIDDPHAWSKKKAREEAATGNEISSDDQADGQ